MEAAEIDGLAYCTCSVPYRCSLRNSNFATLILFTSVGYWNEYFQGLVLSVGSSIINCRLTSNRWSNIQTTNLSMDQIEKMDKLSNQSLDAAKVFIAMVPMLVVYPFLQKYFINRYYAGGCKRIKRKKNRALAERNRRSLFA